jgi:transcriptional regulator with GAF, ATPase, and Fis domain
VRIDVAGRGGLDVGLDVSTDGGNDTERHLVEVVAALKEITVRITAAPALSIAIDDLVKVADGLFPPYVRCGVTLIAQGEPATSAASGLPIEVLDETRHADGDGPCLTAVRSRDIVLSQNLAEEPRWPVWSATARRHGFASVLAYPFDVDALTLGALNLYADRPDAFVHDLPIVAMLIAEHASLLLRVRVRQLLQEDIVAHVADLPTGDAMVERAIGIIMAQRGCSPEQSLRHLHEAATQLGVGLSAVAERLVRTVTDRASA